MNELIINKNSKLYKVLEQLNEEKINHFILSEGNEDTEYFKRCRNIVLMMIEKKYGEYAMKKLLES